MKVAELSRVLEELELDVDPDSLRDAVACFDRLSALLADVVGEFDRAKLFELDGFTSTNMFLRHAGLGESAAARLTATGRRMVVCPATAEAYRSGDLRSGHVDAIVANTPERVLSQYAAQEDEFVPTIAALTTRDASTVMRRWRGYAEDALDAKNNETDSRRELSFSITANGRGELRGSFDPATAELIKTGLERFETKNNPNEPARTAKQRRADALRDIFTFAIENGDDATGTAGRHRPHVTIMVNADNRDAWNLNGEPLSGPIVTSWLCDSLVNRLVMGADGVPLDYGRSERTAPPSQWKAVATRDGGCRFPGCDRPPRWCQAHHLQHWTQGGRTDMDNLALLCTHHHHLNSQLFRSSEPPGSPTCRARTRRLTKQQGSTTVAGTPSCCPTSRSKSPDPTDGSTRADPVASNHQDSCDRPAVHPVAPNRASAGQATPTGSPHRRALNGDGRVGAWQ